MPVKTPSVKQDTARASLTLGRFRAEADIAVRPATILAIGALVSGILLSVVPIIRAARAGAAGRLPPPEQDRIPGQGPTPLLGPPAPRN